MNDLRLPMTFEEAKQILEMEIDWDWEKFRREAAKDILVGLAASSLGVSVDSDPVLAVKLADELIRQLKED